MGDNKPASCFWTGGGDVDSVDAGAWCCFLDVACYEGVVHGVLGVF